MGRAIDQNNRLEDHERRLKLLEDAFEEQLYTNKLSNKKQKKNAKNNAEA